MHISRRPSGDAPLMNDPAAMGTSIDAPRDSVQARPTSYAEQKGSGVLSALKALSCVPRRRASALPSLTPEQLDLNAATFARDCAADPNAFSEHYKFLSCRLCWDAVKYCALQSGIINKSMHDDLSADMDLVSLSDPRI